MRFARVALLLAVGASQAWAQPAPGAEPGAGSGAGSGSAEAPAKEVPVEAPPPSPTPEVGKDQVKQPQAIPMARGFENALPAEPPPELQRQAGFRFGSYGRVLAGSDLRGSKPQKVAVVAHAPRIVEDSYLELELSYGFLRETDKDYIVVRPIITLAFAGTLFHDTGQFDAQPALRNMFLDGQISRDLTLWVGSRMYRGDDIYLFDYWPLDDINTVGAGVMYKPKVSFRGVPQSPGEPMDELQLAAHVGFNRLLNPFQFQQVEVANPVQGATTVDQLNRQRTIASASAAYVMMPHGDGMGAKLKVHGELHKLPSGTRKREDGSSEALPADSGLLIGAELGVFGFSSDKRFRRHINLFTRYAKGLAAFDELAPPTSFGTDLKTNRANEFTFGASANWDHALGNLMVGALSRRFVDADTNTVDPDDGWEYAIDARPLVRVLPDWFVGGDVSYQARFPKGLNPITLRASDPSVFEIAPMITWSPMGPSAYDRPQLRFFYRAAYLNQAALDLYVPMDPRHEHSVVHFIGFAAEWWFNSSTYR